VIRHTHQPDVGVGDQVDAHIHGTADGVYPDGRVLIRYDTANGSHAWITVDPAAAGVGVSVAHPEGSR
jgi:hypothetical protein